MIFGNFRIGKAQLSFGTTDHGSLNCNAYAASGLHWLQDQGRWTGYSLGREYDGGRHLRDDGEVKHRAFPV